MYRKLFANEAGKNNHCLFELYGDVCFNCKNLFGETWCLEVYRIKLYNVMDFEGEGESVSNQRI